MDPVAAADDALREVGAVAVGLDVDELGVKPVSRALVAAVSRTETGPAIATGVIRWAAV